MTLRLVLHRCTVLALGPAKRGWTIVQKSRVLDFGYAKTASERSAAISAARLASNGAYPLVAVVDVSRSPAFSIGRWLEALELAKVKSVALVDSAWRGDRSRSEVCTDVAGEYDIGADFEIGGAVALADWSFRSSDVQEHLPRRKPKLTDPVTIPYLKVYESEG